MQNESNDIRFGLYPWFHEDGADLIHPDDILRFSMLVPYGKIFEVDFCSPDMIQLKYGEQKFRVRPDLLKLIPSPKFRLGDVVSIKNKNVKAEVISSMWHSNEKRAFFLLSANGKKKSKRYWEEDLELVQPS